MKKNKSLKDIAEIAGVSIATVSKVRNGRTDDISEETVIRVMKIIEQEQYIPNAFARAMKTNRSYLLALLIPDITNPFFNEMARGAEDAAYKLGYSLMVCNTDDSWQKEHQYLQTLQELQIDGLLISGATGHDSQEEFTKISVPIVAMDRAVTYPNVKYFVSAQNRKTSYLLGKELLSMGYRSFAYIGGSQSDFITKERFDGLNKALMTHGLNFESSHFGHFHYDYGYDTILSNVKSIINHDCIICGNDLIAMGVIAALSSIGIKVPQEISVVGFDDIPYAKMTTPAISTVRQPAYEMGERSVHLLHEVLTDGKDESSRIIEFPQEIIFRGTTMKR